MPRNAGLRALIPTMMRLLGLTVLVAPVAACCLFRQPPPPPPPPPRPPQAVMLPTCPGDPRCDSSNQVPERR